MIRHSYPYTLVLTLAFTAIIQCATAQSSAVNIVTTSVPFLRISPDARSGGMGDVGVATAPDANASFWNVAKVPFNKSNAGIGVTYTPWLKDLGLNDVYLATMAGYYKLDEDQALSSSIRYFSLGNIQFTDYAGNLLNSYNPKEYSFDIGYSRKLSEKISIGTALRYIYSSLAGGSTINGVTYKAGHAIAGDLTVYSDQTNKSGEGFTWGVALTNLGSKIGYTNDAANKDFIPANMGLGATYTKVFDETNKLTFALDMNKLLVPAAPVSQDNGGPVDSANLASYHSMTVMKGWFKSFNDGSNQMKDLQFSVGAEYTYDNQFTFRAGYFYESAERGNRKYFAVGTGLKYNIFGLNLSYLVPSGNGVTRNPLSNTLRLGVTFDLEKK
jgi:hypothetical protein